jgi:MFS family permease
VVQREAGADGRTQNGARGVAPGAPASVEPLPSGTFAALAVRDFRVMWLGTWASYIPFFMSTIVQSVVAFELAGTNRAVGAVVFAQGVAMSALGPLGGAGADRWPKRRVVTLALATAAIIFGTLALLLAFDALRLASLVAGSLLLGVSISFLGPARQALAAELVPLELRGNAVALNQLPLTGSQVLGPALAGVLLASPAGAAGAYAAMCVLYAVGAISLAWIPASVGRANSHETHVLADLWDGLRYVFSHARLRLLVLFFVSVIMMGFPYVTALPGLVEHEFGRSSEAVSRFFFTSALGGLAASLVAARVADSRFALPVFLALPFVFAAGVLGIALAPSYGLAIGAALFAGVGMGGFQSLNAAVIVRATEPAYFGRVFSLTMLAFAGFGLMGLPVGLLADAIGERATLAALSCVVCATSITIAALLRRTAP